MNPVLVRGLFTSVWDDGAFSITTSCLVNLKTKEVFNIEQEENCEMVEWMDAEYVEIDKIEYPVYPVDEAQNGDYWNNWFFNFLNNRFAIFIDCGISNKRCHYFITFDLQKISCPFDIEVFLRTDKIFGG